MRYIFFIPLLLVFSASVAQDRGGPRQRIQQFKEQYIREILALSEEDANKFFPIYAEYEQEKRETRMEMNQLRRGVMAKSDGELRKDLQAMLEIKKKELAIEEKYMQRFIEVITVRQVAALYYAESQFKRKLLERFGRDE